MPAYQRRVVDDELDELMPTETGDIAPLAGGLCGSDSDDGLVGDYQRCRDWRAG